MTAKFIYVNKYKWLRYKVYNRSVLKYHPTLLKSYNIHAYLHKARDFLFFKKYSGVVSKKSLLKKKNNAEKKESLFILNKFNWEFKNLKSTLFEKKIAYLLKKNYWNSRMKFRPLW
jgi:hypothetical protein